MFGLDVIRDAMGDVILGRMVEYVGGADRGALAVWEDEEKGDLHGRFAAGETTSPNRRRFTGGRTVRTGPGHLRVTLVLPHRSAMESANRLALRPEQALNRCVRGVLDGCRSVGLDVFYPGRDVVTLQRRPIGWLSLGEVGDGRAVFEAGLDVAAAGTSGRFAVGDVRRAVVEAYVGRSGTRPAEIEIADLPSGAVPTLDWPVPPGADRCGRVPTMLGRMQTNLRLSEDRRIEALRISGDVIAPVTTMIAIEEALVGVPALRTTIAETARAVLAKPEHWVLGVDEPAEAIAETIMEAV